MIIGIDAGNYETKVCGSFGVKKFFSDIGEYRERNLKSTFGPDDMVWECEERKGFAGTLAKFESEFGGTLKGDSKAHFDAKLRVLLALHRHCDDETVNLVVGQPISKHNEGEKQKIVTMLKGKQTIKVNGISKTFYIKTVHVGVEGGTSLLSNPINGLARIIDVGSGTINFATLHDMRYVDRDSFTERFGLSTIKSKDYENIARRIESLALDKWEREDELFIMGGGAQVLYPYLKERFQNIHLMQPIFRGRFYSPEFSNAIGFHKLGEIVNG